MKKTTRRLLGVLLAAVMMMGLSVTSFASTHDVTVHIAKRDTTVSPYVVTSFTELPGQTISLSSVDSSTTLQNVVNSALAQQASTSGTAFSAGWTSVPASGSYSAYEYLSSMVLAGTTYSGSYQIEDYGTNQHKYTGTSWVWNYNGGSNYPDDYMDQTTIGSHRNLYLFYETSSFIY